MLYFGVKDALKVRIVVSKSCERRGFVGLIRRNLISAQSGAAKQRSRLLVTFEHAGNAGIDL